MPLTSHLTLCRGQFSTFKARSLLRIGGILQLVKDRVQAALHIELDILNYSNHRADLLALTPPVQL